MSDASSVRNAKSLSSATSRNQGSIRYHQPSRRVVFSDGSQWVDPSRGNGKYTQARYNVKANSELATATFFLANKACRVVGIEQVHSTAGNDSGAVTLQVTKETGTTAAGSGTELLASAFNLKGTANTVQHGTLISSVNSENYLFLQPGERLSVKYTGTLTSLAGVVVTVTLEYPTSEFDVSFTQFINGDAADECFFVATEPYEVVAISEIHSTKGTHGSAVNIQVTKDTSTNAPGAGTDLLTNNSNAGFDAKGAVQTVQTGTLTSTASALVLAKGDRLSVDYAGTVTSVAGVTVSVTLRPLNRRRCAVTLNHQDNGDATDECFFVADRPCSIVAISEVHSTAGSDGSAVNLQVVKDTGTDAPGAGTNLLTDNSSAGFDLKGTANTVQHGTLTTTNAALMLAKGDRLSVDYAGTVAALVGVTVTVVLEYIY